MHKLVFEVPVLMDFTVERKRKLSKPLHCAICGQYRVPKGFIARVINFHSFEAQKRVSP